MPEFDATTASLEGTGRATRRELMTLLAADGRQTRALLAAADRVRAAVAGDEVHLRALIEFSSHCRRNCRYCGLRRDNGGLARYRMRPEEIRAAARAAADLGYQTVVLQSGEDAGCDIRQLAHVIGGIKRDREVAVTLAIGERSAEDYAVLRGAGADRFLLRVETSSPALYRRLHPDSEWRDRVRALTVLRRLGYQTGSGVMIGLPGQSLRTLADDLLLLQSLDLDMIGVGPFIPHPATPLAGARAGDLDLALRFIACLRMLCPAALIPATTALAARDPARGWERGLAAGADVLMPNVTPLCYRARYDIYAGKMWNSHAPADFRPRVDDLLARMGRRPGSGPGHSRIRRAVSTARGSEGTARAAVARGRSLRWKEQM